MDVLAAIDGALQDYETSGDVMRWVPPGDRAEPAPLAITTPVMLDTEAFMRDMRQLAIAVNSALRPFAELLRKLTPTVQVIHEARRAQLSAMHREYHRRQRARRRRKR